MYFGKNNISRDVLYLHFADISILSRHLFSDSDTNQYRYSGVVVAWLLFTIKID